MKLRASALVPFAIAALSVSGCGSAAPAQAPPAIQPGAPGQNSRALAPGEGHAPPAATAADVAFMQGMIHHHAQALDMTDLLETRTQDPDMKKLALRIHV